MNISAVYIVLLADAIFCLYRSKNISEHAGSVVKLTCPDSAWHHCDSWRGPPNLTIIAVNAKINPRIQARRHNISGGLDGKDCTLQISNFSVDDAGEYMCGTRSENKAMIHQTKYYLSITDTPYQKGNNLRKTKKYVYQCTVIDVQADVHLYIVETESFIQNKRNEVTIDISTAMGNKTIQLICNASMVNEVTAKQIFVVGLPFLLTALSSINVKHIQTICEQRPLVKDMGKDSINAVKNQDIFWKLKTTGTGFDSGQYNATCKRTDLMYRNHENCLTEFTFSETAMQHSDYMGRFVETMSTDLNIKSFFKSNMYSKNSWTLTERYRTNEDEMDVIDRSLIYSLTSGQHGMCNENDLNYISDSNFAVKIILPVGSISVIVITAIVTLIRILYIKVRSQNLNSNGPESSFVEVPVQEAGPVAQNMMYQLFESRNVQSDHVNRVNISEAREHRVGHYNPSATDQRGINYVELAFENRSLGSTVNVHWSENRTLYSEVDHSNTAPLSVPPDGSDIENNNSDDEDFIYIDELIINNY